MKKAIKKLALVAAILSCALSVNAQDDFSTLYGTYAGSMSTTVFSEQNPDGIPLALKDVRFDLSKGEANFYTLTLKDYSMANKLHFADIPLTDNHIIKDGADWKIEQVNNAYGQYPTSDNKYLVTLVISIPNQESNKISATGQMQLSLVVLYKETKIEHVFNGEKKKNSTGLHTITSDNQQPKIYYDLQGRRVEKPGRGIYIVNGKKIVLSDDAR